MKTLGFCQLVPAVVCLVLAFYCFNEGLKFFAGVFVALTLTYLVPGDYRAH